jgi:xanthine dehydrogenase accessory factor
MDPLTVRALDRFYRSHSGPFCLATLVRALGATYRPPGARMLITEDGGFAGSLSSGCLEEEIAELGKHVLRSGKSQFVSIDLRPRFACDGTIEVFLEPRSKADPFFVELAQLLQHRQPVLAVTAYGMAPYQTSSVREPMSVGEGCFFEQILPVPRLLVFGEQRDTVPVAQLAAFLGWDCERVSGADVLSESDAQTACLIMSHNLGRDALALQKCLASDCGYIGLIGSHRRKERIVAELLERGLDPQLLQRLYTPAGLDTGAETSEEIAVAIVAEINMVLAGRAGGSLREKRASYSAAEMPGSWCGSG